MPAVRFPRIGFATAEGTILRWLKNVGEPVQAGQDLLEVTAEKAIAVVVAEEEGVLAAIYAPAGAIVAEGEMVGWIGRGDGPAPRHEPGLRGWAEEIAPAPEDLAQRLRITAEAPAPAHGERVPGRVHGAERPGRPVRAFVKGQIRQVTAQRMAAAWQAPKVDLFTDVDFSRVVAHRQALKAAGREAPSYNVYIAHAASRAFEAFPHLNANWIDGRRVPLEGIHIGVAVALEEDLVTISMKNVGGLDLEALQGRFKALIRKAAAMSLAPEELYGSSLTITNLGEYEVTGFTAVLNPPEIFILAIGMLQERVVAREGGFTTIPFSTFCLSFDHRGVDGAPASRLLRQIKHNLERYE